MSQETNEESKESAENEVSIYEQDCEFYRHQDQLRWGRFQTAATVEGALLYALYGLEKPIAEPARFVIEIIGSVLVFLICVLSLKDQSDAKGHLDRIKHFEQSNPFPKGNAFFRVRGSVVMVVAIVLINLVNALLLCFGHR